MIMPHTEDRVTFSGSTIRGRVKDARVLPLNLAHFFKSRDFAEGIKHVSRGANIKNLSQDLLEELPIAVPPLDVQRHIVREVEVEHSLIVANRELIARMEKKIQATLSRVWGEEAEPAPAEEA